MKARFLWIVFAFSLAIACAPDAHAQEPRARDAVRLGARFDAELWYAPVLFPLLPEMRDPYWVFFTKEAIASCLLDLGLCAELVLDSFSIGAGVIYLRDLDVPIAFGDVFLGLRFTSSGEGRR